MDSVQIARNNHSIPIRVLLAIAFTLSGFSALAYQVSWQRVLTQVVGSDAVSVVLIVTIFMIWLGVGAEIARRLLPHLKDKAGVAYASLEIIVGIVGLFSVPLLRATNSYIATFNINSLALDIIVNLILLAIPVIGMGMTTPLIVEVAKKRLTNLGQVVGLYYGLNIFGAALGALFTGLVLIEILGIYGVSVVAAAINIIIGVSIFYIFSYKSSGQQQLSISSSSASTKNTSINKAGNTRVSAILFGFGTLALQIIFFRVLSNYFTLSVVVFPVVLCAYLLLMSIGQFVGGKLADIFYNRLYAVITGLFSVGALLLIATLNFPSELAAKLGTLIFTSFNGQLIRDTHPQLIGDPEPFVVLLFSFMFMLSVLAWSALFPVMLRVITQKVDDASQNFASLYGFYTAGNVLGSLITGLVLFELVGTGITAIITVFVMAFGVLILVNTSKRITERNTFVVLVILFCTPFFISKNYYKNFKLGDYKITEVFEGKNGVATVVELDRFYTIIDMNRTASASAMKYYPEEHELYQAWRWNHTELFALDPSYRPKNVLIIGLGHAYLIDSLLELPFIEKITIVDLSHEVVDAVKKYTLAPTKRIFSDPRVEILIEDGRRFVQKAIASGKKYDLIQTKVNEPWHAGAGNLFTVDFFESQKKLLSKNGYLGVRPIGGHVGDGVKVFGTAIWPGYYHLFFKNGKFNLPKEAIVTPDIHDAWFQTLPGQVDLSKKREPYLEVVHFPCCDYGRGMKHNTDDRPTFEYDWLARTSGTWTTPRTPLWYEDLPTQRIPVRIESTNK